MKKNCACRLWQLSISPCSDPVIPPSRGPGVRENYLCKGKQGENLDLLEDFVNEIKEKGYYDPHIYPLTYAM